MDSKDQMYFILLSLSYKYTYLSISPDKVGLGVAGVMDHHLLLPHATFTATRGAAAAVVVKKDDGHQGGHDE